MIKEVTLRIHPDFINDSFFIKKQISKKIKLKFDRIFGYKIKRKSIDARKRIPIFVLQVEIYIDKFPSENKINFNYNFPSKGKKVIVVGSGPAGLFGALYLLENGITPIVLERGKKIRERRKDIRKINIEHKVNLNSNYCFGEGGAGTFSDGKLYTRSTKRGDVGRILEIFVFHGADKNITFEAHPHIGSDKLPQIIESIRKTILENGGEVRFNSQVTDLILSNNKINGVVVNSSDEIFADAVLLATGHSARDVYYMLEKHKIRLEPKSFAMGVRIEHPQNLINEIQYHSKIKHPNLPTATYTLKTQINKKGVFSFCMCPGGILVPASTGENELVLNGMSVSKRNSQFANSGLVVTVNEEDWNEFNNRGIFAGLEFQKYFERMCFNEGGKSQIAPAQRITDFVAGKISETLPQTSYKPGTVSRPLHKIIPKTISERLQKSLLEFDKKMRGYFTKEAQILAPESRTSSPIRIPRNDKFMHVEVDGLFPAGEGAGYAGGIVSAAIDGENCAKGICDYLR